VVERLRELGVRSVGIFTGDRRPVAERVGQAVGVDLIEAECLPEEKYAKLEALIAQNRRVLMVGDGINDGPSLAIADVGVAMGLSGSDIATNSAGVALMNDDLSRVPFLVDLARKTRVIVAQNIVAAILIAMIGLVLAATGSLTVFFAAFYHFLGDLFVLGNSFRLIRFGEDFATGDGAAHAPQPARTPAVSQPAPTPAAATA
jgi:P-type E1-E2 ATPase